MATLVGYLHEKFQFKLSYPGHNTMRVGHNDVEVLSVSCPLDVSYECYETALLDKDGGVAYDKDWGYGDILRFMTVGTLVKEIKRVLELVSKKRRADYPHEDEPSHKVLALDK
jgi:hypothetical protein